MRLFALVLASVLLCAAETKLGKPLALKSPLPVADVTAKPEKFAGKTVQVKGKVTEVCQAMGCWMMIADDAGHAIRIKVEDGAIVFPKDAAGKTAIAEGKLARIELTREQAIAQAKHEAAESGRNFDEASVKGPVVRYQIDGSGAVILD